MFRKQSKLNLALIEKKLVSSSAMRKLSITPGKKDNIVTIPKFSKSYLMKHSKVMPKQKKLTAEEYFKRKPKLFSLLDINDKVTNSKGPNIPFQYLRISNEEYLKMQSYPTSHLFHSNNDEEEDKNKKDLSARHTIENAHSINSFQASFQAFTENNKPLAKNPMTAKSISCEDIFANPNIKHKHFKYKNISLSLLKAKNLASDIFFTKCSNEEDDFKAKAGKYPDFQRSDIFSVRSSNEPLFNYKGNYYSNTKESQIEVQTKNSIPTYLNYSSTEFDILSNRIPSLPRSKLAIATECNKQGIGLNALNKQNFCCENISDSNRNYVKYFNENVKPFNRLKNLCSNFIDIHNRYSNLCELPFVKKKMA